VSTATDQDHELAGRLTCEFVRLGCSIPAWVSAGRLVLMSKLTVHGLRITVAGNPYPTRYRPRVSVWLTV
jgi:hypothetical protein